MKNIAIILAGGIGSRLGYKKPKQFIKVAGKFVIEHTIDVFQKNINIDEIVVVCHPDYISLIEEIVNVNKIDKVKKILNGGKERSDSSSVAINAYDDEVNFIFHDAVRPLVNDRIINDVVLALEKYNAVDVAIPATDTIIEVKKKHITSIPNRNKLYRGQTPQAFRSSLIRKAYGIAMQDENFIATDDCGIVKKYLPNEEIYVVPGEEFNIKLTYEEDIFLMDKLFQLKSTEILDENEDRFEKLNGKVIIVFGGSYGIGSDIIKLAKDYGAKTYSFSRGSNNTDVANVDDIKDAIDCVFSIEKRIDYVVNTAGILDKESLVNMSYETISRAISVNYFGAIIVAKESFPYLEKSRGGLLFFTSSSYTRGRAMYSTYSSLKAASVNLTQALSSEWETFGISVNCINPERTLTPMRLKNFGKEDTATLLKSTEVARASLKTLLSDLSGQVIDVKIK